MGHIHCRWVIQTDGLDRWTWAELLDCWLSLAPGCGKESEKWQRESGNSDGTDRPESVKSGRRQTRLAVRLVRAVSVDRDGIFVRGQLHWIPKRPRIASAVVSGGEHA
ncbi:hypothetical protein CRG98_041509 [Punica granatum]|uniref:Uncharacterized protein n=1 Tax=Punica granatum TaxID=22663 RepID=A0A2I0I2P3_PUNGR|nr:hypothetical protein CRG98_041509 [Punica granatum]